MSKQRSQPEGEVVFRDGNLVITVDESARAPMSGAYVVPHTRNDGMVRPSSAPQLEFAESDGLMAIDRSKITAEMTKRAHELATEALANREYLDEEVKAGAVAADATTLYMRFLQQLIAENEAPRAAKPAIPEVQVAKLVAAPATEAGTPQALELGIPDLYAVPTRPAESVTFELPGFGRHKVRYHWVIADGPLVTLVYDTRYDGGDPFIPPVPAEDKSLKLTIHVTPEETLYVFPTGNTISFGCFLLIPLVIDSARSEAVEFAGFEPE